MHVRRACGLESRWRGTLEEWCAYSFNACYQLLCISLLFRNSRKPPRLEPVARPLLSTASVSFLPTVLLFVSPSPSTQPLLALGSRVLVPAASYSTRCFINENEGASYIFLTKSRPALVFHPSFFPSWISSFWHYCYHFPRHSHRLDEELTQPGVLLRPLYSPSLPPLLAAVILLSVYWTGLPGMRQRALRKINSDWHHACSVIRDRIYGKKIKVYAPSFWY